MRSGGRWTQKGMGMSARSPVMKTKKMTRGRGWRMGRFSGRIGRRRRKRRVKATVTLKRGRG
jgi:hypothetical protein